jgi:membrane fusion protein, multidrug efflux system
VIANLARVLIVALLVTLPWAGCKRPQPFAKTGPPTVTVAKPARETVAPSMDLTGTVSAHQTVNLVARVDGFLDTISFQDGSFVNKDQVLFQIEKDMYEQKVALYQAQLTGAQAEYTRQLGMLKQNATSQANVDKALSDRDQAVANVAMAKIQLGYTTVRAPFDGRIGEHLVDVGNVVGADAASPTKLATIDQMVPIYIYFYVSSRDALRLRKIATQKFGGGVKPGVGKIPVAAGLDDEEGFPHKGILDFADNSVDTKTGTVQLRAIFGNEDKILFPGLFARVRIPLGTPEPEFVVPNTAVANDQVGDYVLVANAQDVAERRDVQLGARVGAMRAITQGLNENDRVIIGGEASVRPGATVAPQEATTTPAPTAAKQK